MRTLRQLLTALKADAHPDARAIKIHENANVSPPPAGSTFVAVNPGESEPLPITDGEKAMLLEAGATHDDREIYPAPGTDG
jgi:hypothetical protein